MFNAFQSLAIVVVVTLVVYGTYYSLFQNLSF